MDMQKLLIELMKYRELSNHHYMQDSSKRKVEKAFEVITSHIVFELIDDDMETSALKGAGNE